MLVTINTVPQSPNSEFFKTSQIQSSPFAPVYQNLLCLLFNLSCNECAFKVIYLSVGFLYPYIYLEGWFEPKKLRLQTYLKHKGHKF